MEIWNENGTVVGCGCGGDGGCGCGGYDGCGSEADRVLAVEVGKKRKMTPNWNDPNERAVIGDVGGDPAAAVAADDDVDVDEAKLTRKLLMEAVPAVVVVVAGATVVGQEEWER